ncbi:MAG: alpha-ketoglutarate-dependent dioxygenase AlkB [Gammaproteobacteria bacterium]|nr:alpha-ketoglutarate-dependent dioxygenase AlkB [Gammaproteobacteria bacterium]
MFDLFSHPDPITPTQPEVLDLGDGVFHIKRLAPVELCMLHIHRILKFAPLRHMMTPMGHPTQVKMSNCGDYGWVSDESGYRYSQLDPESQRPWPCLPAEFLQLHKYACQLAGLVPFQPDACLINCYEIGTAMGRHRDKDEQDTSWPIVSISLGLSAVFQVFGDSRNAKTKNIQLDSGDVVILSGASRQYYHGVKPVKLDPLQPNLTQRYNLTLRKSQ